MNKPGTQLPWFAKGCTFDDGKGGVHGSCHWDGNSLERAMANAQYAAHAANAYPRLVEALKAVVSLHCQHERPGEPWPDTQARDLLRELGELE